MDGLHRRIHPWADGCNTGCVSERRSTTLAAAPLVLLGVLSGSSARQRLLRCTWMRSDGFGIRIVFVVGRDAEHVSINLKGRPVKIPLELVEEVRLPGAKTEAGDPLAKS